MNIIFGYIEKYLPEKGFGFVKGIEDSFNTSGVFIHISVIKKYDINIYNKLLDYDTNSKIYFWYETELLKKGVQVVRIFNQFDFKNLLRNSSFGITLLNDYSLILKNYWEDFKNEKPFWLEELSLFIFELDVLNQLKNQRLNFLKEQEIIKENKRIELENIRLEEEKVRTIEEEKIKLIEEKNRKIKYDEELRQREIERVIEDNQNQEFELLVAEIKTLGFTESAQVSRHIIRNRLGDKYKHISGVLKMENNNSVWNFNGGFPPHIYARLCQELNLGNRGTDSRVVSFKAFKDL